MRFLRMLSNAAIAGALASGYLAVLVLHLNPSFPIAPGALVPLAAVLGAAYGANLAVLFYALIVLRQLLADEVLSPGWLSVRLLSWLCTLAAVGGGAVLWLNLAAFAPMLDPRTIQRMMIAAVAVTACGAVFLVIALAHVGRRGGRLSATILTLAMALSLGLPIAARGPATPLPEPRAGAPVAVTEDAAWPQGRVLLLGVDGASLDFIRLAAVQGRLPNLGRLLDGGASLHLATLRPTQPEPVWTAVATGRLPVHNGVRSAARYAVRPGGPAIDLLPDYCFARALVRFGFLVEEPHTPASLRARPIWEILSGLGVEVGAIGWPLTHPAPAVRGYVVSDELHRLDAARLAIEGAAAVHPPELLAQIAEAAPVEMPVDPLDVVSTLGEVPPGDVDVRRDPAPLVADRLHLQIFEHMEARAPARFVALRLPGLDAVGHYYLRYAVPQPFGDVTEDERQRYGHVLDEYYAVIDGVVGRLMGALGPADLLLVVSPFGMEPLSPGKRVLERLVGNPRVSGSHERAPDGFLLAYGAGVAARRLPRASVLDVTPTILYALGLPIGRDMDGFARTDVFTEAFTARVPLTFIPSYGR